MPGLGQLYLGRPLRGLVLLFGLAALQLSVCCLVFFAAPQSKWSVTLAGFAALLLGYVAGILDAFIQARRRRRFDSSRYRRALWGWAYFVLAALAAAGVLHAERLTLIDVYRIHATSMRPGLLHGDYVLVDRQASCLDCAQPLCRGDIVVFSQDGSTLIKRIVGLPGDRIEIENQTLRINGQKATGSPVDSLGDAELDHFHRSSLARSETLGRHTYLSLWSRAKEKEPLHADVPPDHVFVLGDNRHHSKDSRQLGAIPLNRVRGRADQAWLSLDQRAGTDLSRIGPALSFGPCQEPAPRAVAGQESSLAPSDAPSSPNLLLITVDTLRADHVGAYGHAKARTETLDGIAALGVRFENALTPFPRTTPALASLFTGLSPQNHGSRDVGVPIQRGQTLAEVLKERGYATLAVSSTALAGKKQGFGRGFEQFVGRTEDMGPMNATEVTERALELVAEAPEDKPKFLWLHYFDPHFPYRPPPGWGNPPEAPNCRRLTQKVLANPRIQWSLHSNWGRMAEEALSDCLELYDEEIHYTDTEIAQLLYGLGKSDFLKSVILVVTADHGESFGESGTYYEHGATVHDAVVRIPLMIAGPDIDPGVENALISLEDLMPTLLGLLSVPPEAQPDMDGRNFSASLRKSTTEQEAPFRAMFAEGANANKPPLFALPFDAAGIREACTPGEPLERCREFAGVGELLAAIMAVDTRTHTLPDLASITKASDAIQTRFRAGQARQRSVRTPRFKLVQAPRVDGGTQRRLFEPARDPLETTDIGAQHPQIRDQLEAELDTWLSQAPQPTLHEFDPQEIKALRALGYLK